MTPINPFGNALQGRGGKDHPQEAALEYHLLSGHDVARILDDQKSHVLLKVSLKGGEDYALEFTSAQYGYHSPVSLWQEYVRERVSEVTYLATFGTSKIHIDREALHAPGTVKEGISLHHQKATATLDNAVKNWLAANKTTFKHLLHLDKENFPNKRDELLAAIDNDLVDFVKSAERKAASKAWNRKC
ncbi:hypothetical protein MMC30_001701 [Trapelia coarctata]|nr:hypothetical protein [Trapelia coarctata]